MPRHKQPPTLERLSMQTTVANILDKCRRMPGQLCVSPVMQLRHHRVSDYIERIPGHLANDFTIEVLSQLAGVEQAAVWSHWVFHPSTTRLLVTQNWTMLDALQKHWVR